MMLEKTMRINYLFDFYQELLTPKQREYMSLYYIEDYSLVEIADALNVSRQAVYDNLKRTETALEDYENKLNLYHKFNERRQLILTLDNKLGSYKDRDVSSILEQLKNLS